MYFLGHIDNFQHIIFLLTLYIIDIYMRTRNGELSTIFCLSDIFRAFLPVLDLVKMSSTENRYDFYRSSTRDEELQEEDVWGVFKERKNSNSRISTFKESNISLRRSSTTARMIPRSNSSNVHEPKLVQLSAPVNIPDWSKIYGSPRTASQNESWIDDDDGGGGGGGGGGANGVNQSGRDSEEEEEDDDGSMLPPHEWSARRLARKQMFSFSMCEGVGRTLKGRDLSRVRNAVLTKTGFLE